MPPTSLHLPLGAGRAPALQVGPKAALLDRAAEAGLPVPRGVIVLDATWRRALAEHWITRNGVEVRPRAPADLVQALALPPLAERVAVRSAFSAEDAAEASLAGRFTSHLRVDARNAVSLAAALCDVWASALDQDATLRRDVLIMDMVDAGAAGVAFTERAFEDDRVNFTWSTAERLLGGEERGEELNLPKLRPWERRVEPPVEVPFAVRLQRLLRDVRKVFGAEDWDVEWADDGTTCWLLQVRPVTRPTRRNETFTIANHKEILPELPSRFMTSLIASCADQLFAYYRRFDPELPEHRPFIEVFRGRPYLNLSLLTEMMRIWGLPTRLVTDSIGGAAGRAAGLNPGRIVRKLPALSRLAWAQRQAVPSARRTIQTILARTAVSGSSFAATIEMLRWLYVTLVTEMFSLTAAMSGPLFLLRRLGTLAEHSARQRTVATQLYTDLVPIRRLVAARPDLRDRLGRDELPEDLLFQDVWQAYLARHGHRGVYESDIARPRFHEQPEALLPALLSPMTYPARPPAPTPAGRLTRSLWMRAAHPIQAREDLRYQAMRGFNRIRQTLLNLADQAVEQGRLPGREALWMLTIDEAARLDAGWRPGRAFFDARAQEIEELKQYRLPDLLHRFDDLERYRRANGTGNGSARLSGISLTPGTLWGRAWVLQEPSTALPPGFQEATTILVARSVDAGWVPTFARVAGVVVETGGDLSHGSIILRELGLPAVTNVAGATRAFQSGTLLQLRAGEGIVERLD